MNPQLTDQEKNIMFEGGTEAPFSGALLHEHGKGDFLCKNCNTVLFASDTKFDSGSGWPSFTEPKNRSNVILKEDTSHGMYRIEALCAHCGAHLGHVFDDGPQDAGGQRYCINSASLTFDSKEKNND